MLLQSFYCSLHVPNSWERHHVYKRIRSIHSSRGQPPRLVQQSQTRNLIGRPGLPSFARTYLKVGPLKTESRCRKSERDAGEHATAWACAMLCASSRISVVARSTRDSMRYLIALDGNRQIEHSCSISMNFFFLRRSIHRRSLTMPGGIRMEPINQKWLKQRSIISFIRKISFLTNVNTNAHSWKRFNTVLICIAMLNGLKKWSITSCRVLYISISIFRHFICQNVSLSEHVSTMTMALW